MSAECASDRDALADLTAFQRDLLWALSHENARKGTALNAYLADYYGEEINHSRLYQNLDTLVEYGLVTQKSRDGRTNEYSLTDAARHTLQARRVWQVRGETT
ncbi:helix-turn-helix transcriptional regulator (plasmid) [Halorubrum salinarum]|uniref:Helix-turn-helix transcriptional regulator n=1 Tax=Halorubrum salinarum TaxID=2739057 RepID=A0A7D4BS73_9EURY|nr:helix-turn-helix transcriptional regulator [Halorubrum salinarum]QKG94337.1 helix-turn-helix transcriptional regulator [Halorubrum salinarum]